jgi:hypothetical protein
LPFTFSPTPTLGISIGSLILYQSISIMPFFTSLLSLYCHLFSTVSLLIIWLERAKVEGIYKKGEGQFKAGQKSQ